MKQIIALDNIKLNPDLVRRMPIEIACKYHMLPVAEAKGRVTVAMADPADVQALKAIEAVFGGRPYLVKSDQQTIDRLLAEIWAEKSPKPLRILLYSPPTCTSEGVRSYANRLALLLQAELHCHQEHVGPEADFDSLQRESTHGWDLILFGEPQQTLKQRLLSGPPVQFILQRISTSILFVTNPLWPIRKILHILRCEDVDYSVIDWACKIAQPSDAEVTLLTVVPQIPGVFQGLPKMRISLHDILSTDCTLGIHLREVARRLDHRSIQSNIRILQGTPYWQIRSEIIEGAYDLIAVGEDPTGWLVNQLKGNLVRQLLTSTRRPVLVVK
ncbi:MAG: universal stress protein [Anaerolineales bacterium]|nr:universal stress protein [Anaerolineales bacterium]